MESKGEREILSLREAIRGGSRSGAGRFSGLQHGERIRNDYCKRTAHSNNADARKIGEVIRKWCTVTTRQKRKQPEDELGIPGPGPQPMARSRTNRLKTIRDRLALRKQQQIIRPAGFRVGAAHVESAKRLHTNQRAGAFAVEIQIADMKLFAGALEPVP